MSIKRQQRVFELLDEVLEQAPERRAKFLDQVDDTDTGVRREVEALLETESSPKLLDEPVFNVHANDSGIGRKIGDYTLTELLERGGMGAVYLAEREHFEQQVAVKVIRRGLDLDQVSVSRFHNERQILARLTHPNIARLLDGGTTEDHLPYFVMEYVEGEPITRHCRQQQLSIGARLKLFRKVCSAVQFAHRNLVVHRDLKPGNILVTAEGEPKLLDFGIAKLLDQNLAVHPFATLTGEGPMTPRYASPEQIKLDPITTASDVYSLGVLLYELLTGLDPYHVDSGHRIEMARAICEDEPDKPSTAVRRRAEECTTNGRAPATSPEASTERETDPKKLRRRLSGDLDSIVLKAMRKEPDLRYSSVEQLSEDIGRHLDGRPVAARSGAFSYRAVKFVRRNRIPIFAAGIFLISVTTLGLSLQRSAQEMKTALIRSESSSNASTAISEYLVRLLKDYTAGTLSPNAATEVNQQFARWSLKRLDNEFSDTDEQVPREEQIDITRGLGRIFLDLGLKDEAEVLMKQTLSIARDAYGEIHPEVATSLSNLAVSLHKAERFREAEELLRKTLKMRRSLGQKESDLSITKNNLASSLLAQGQLEEALDLFLEVLRVRQKAYRWISGDKDPDVASSHRFVAVAYLALRDYDNAEVHARKALEIERAIGRSGRKAVGFAAKVLADVLLARGSLTEAAQFYKTALSVKLAKNGATNWGTATTKKDFAAVLISSDRSAARKLIDDSLMIFARRPNRWETAEAHSILGGILTAEGLYVDAEPLVVNGLERLLKERGDESWRTRNALQRVIDLYEAWNKPKELERFRKLQREWGS